MATLFISGALAVVIAGLMAFWELSTSKYPREMFLVCKCPCLYFYALVYAVAAAGIMWFYETVAPHNGPHSPIGANLWYRAIVVGLFTKSFCHLKLFSIPGKSEPVPIGMETVANLFIPWLTAEIDLGVENRRVDFLASRFETVTLQQARDRIKDAIPEQMDPRDRDGFLTSIEKSDSVRRAATLFLRLVGRRRFEQVFPVVVRTVAASVTDAAHKLDQVLDRLEKKKVDIKIPQAQKQKEEALSGSATGLVLPGSMDDPPPKA